MPWQLRVHDHPVVELQFSGRLDLRELRESMKATQAALVRARTALLLTDCRQIEGGHSMTDLYDLMEEVTGNGMRGHLREALLLPDNPEARERARFWETLGVNNGVTVRTFVDRDAALSWLAETSGATPPPAGTLGTPLRR